VEAASADVTIEQKPEEKKPVVEEAADQITIKKKVFVEEEEEKVSIKKKKKPSISVEKETKEPGPDTEASFEIKKKPEEEKKPEDAEETFEMTVQVSFVRF